MPFLSRIKAGFTESEVWLLCVNLGWRRGGKKGGAERQSEGEAVGCCAMIRVPWIFRKFKKNKNKNKTTHRMLGVVAFLIETHRGTKEPSVTGRRRPWLHLRGMASIFRGRQRNRPSEQKLRYCSKHQYSEM